MFYERSMDGLKERFYNSNLSIESKRYRGHHTTGLYIQIRHLIKNNFFFDSRIFFKNKREIFFLLICADGLICVF